MAHCLHAVQVWTLQHMRVRTGWMRERHFLLLLPPNCRLPGRVHTGNVRKLHSEAAFKTKKGS
jgi:hypothetical protein